MKKSRELTEEQLSQLQALVSSPAFNSLKALLDIYREECFSILTTSKETSKIFETQGRLIGINVVENLPELFIKQRKIAADRKTKKDEIVKKI